MKKIYALILFLLVLFCFWSFMTKNQDDPTQRVLAIIKESDLHFRWQNEATIKANNRILSSIAIKVQNEGNRDLGVEMLKEAKSVSQLSDNTRLLITTIRKKILAQCGGYEGTSVNELEALMIGDGNGYGYLLKNKVEKCIQAIDSIAHLKGLTGNEIYTIKVDSRWKELDFSNFYFKGLGPANAMLKLTTLESEILEREKWALESIASELQTDIKLNEVVPVVRPLSNTVSLGEKFEGDMFLGALNSYLSVRMLVNNKPIEVDPLTKTGKFSIVPAPCTFDSSGTCKQKIKCEIIFKFRGKDSSIVSEYNYSVVKSRFKN